MSAFLILFASVSRNTPADQGLEYGTGKNGEEIRGSKILEKNALCDKGNSCRFKPTL